MPLSFKSKAAQIAHQQSQVRAASATVGLLPGALPQDSLQSELVNVGAAFPAVEIQDAIKNPRAYNRDNLRKIVMILSGNQFPLVAQALQKAVDVADVEDLLDQPAPIVQGPSKTSKIATPED